MAVNPRINLPTLPAWLDLERCAGCGDLYREHNSGVSFSLGCARIRQAASRDGDESGGYRSVGAVLWALRVLKAEDWLLTHADCGSGASQDVWQEWDSWPGEDPF